MHEIRLTRQACRDLDTLDKRMLTRIKSALKRLAAELVSGKRLLGNYDGEWSYEVGEYRIIYKLENNRMIVLILEHGSR